MDDFESAQLCTLILSRSTFFGGYDQTAFQGKGLWNCIKQHFEWGRKKDDLCTTLAIMKSARMAGSITM